MLLTHLPIRLFEVPVQYLDDKTQSTLLLN